MLRSFGLPAVILLFIMVLSHSAYAETQPAARVTSVEYPQAVLPGTAFQVKINAWYSNAFLSDVGVWDVNSGLMVQSMTFISQFSGPGNVSFTLSLTAPKAPSPWHLLAVNRVWWQNAWYQDPNGGERRFTVSVSRNVSLTLGLGSMGANTQISVDGTPYEILNSSYVAVQLKPGTHLLAAPTIIQSSMDQRYVFVGWSDGVNSNPHSIFLVAPSTIYAHYRTEFYLSAQSDVGQIAGGGWYPRGTRATVAVAPYAVTTHFGYADEYRFAGWSGASGSESNVLVLWMDGPKQIEANWVAAGQVIDTNVFAGAFLLCCLPLLGRLALLRLWRRSKTSLTPHTAGVDGWGPLVLILVLLASPLLFPVAHAQGLPQPGGASVVGIGDAEWLYWAHPGGDTCLIWLGGGVPEQAEPGYYAYFINPFAYESFDTIRFIQDLTNYYCIIALQQGSFQSFGSGVNRTIYQELFQPESRTIEEVHAWIAGQGYSHTFVVGYSVGGQAAVSDLTITHPEDWTAADGVILITVPFSQDLVNNAKELRANLFIIYGGNLPSYEASGIEFYNNTRPEGYDANGYYHKEFHVIDDAGHEVWTIRATGEYDRRALNLMIGFIEKSKALQLTRGPRSPFGNFTNSTTANVLSVQTPQRANVGEAFLVRANVSFQSQAAGSTILAAYIPGEAGILSLVSLPSEAKVAAIIVIPPISKNMNLVLSFAVFRNSSGNWVRASNTYSTALAISDLVWLTVQTSIPGVSFSFDGTNYATNSTGFAKLQTAPGQHLVEVQPFIYSDNVSRLRFVGWEDYTNPISRHVSLSGNGTIEISYLRQYLVQINSTYGQTDGSGWYDANSTAAAQVQQPILNSPPVIFSHWSPVSNQSQTRLLFRVRAPQVISAVWDTANVGPLPHQNLRDPKLTLSILSLFILAMLNVNAPPRKQVLEPREE